MSTATAPEVAPVPLVLYPPEAQNIIMNASRATGGLRAMMSAMLDFCQTRSVAQLEEFKTQSHWDSFYFESDQSKQDFFSSLENLSKIHPITGWIFATEAELRQVAQNYLDNLPASDVLKRLEATKDITGYVSVNIIDLALHILYESRILIPCGSPTACYAANIDSNLYSFLSKMVAVMCANSGRESIVPLLLHLENQTEALYNLGNSVDALKKTIEDKEKEIIRLTTNVESLKNQSVGSSQFGWEV